MSCLAENIIVHWDMPLALLAFYGGLTSEEFVDDFEQYVLVRQFVDVRLIIFHTQLCKNSIQSVQWTSQDVVYFQ